MQLSHSKDARNRLIDLEHCTDEEKNVLQKEFAKVQVRERLPVREEPTLRQRIFDEVSSQVALAKINGEFKAALRGTFEVATGLNRRVALGGPNLLEEKYDGCHGLPPD